MKIRWTKESVRCRITPDELEALRRGEKVAEMLVLAGDTVWSLAIVPNAAATTLAFEAEVVKVSLSENDLAQLLEPDREGVYFQRDSDAGASIRYFVEKDFPCAHPRAVEALEPPTETFDPPPGFEERKRG